MKKRKITLKIANRDYPLTVENEQEEAYYRKAAEHIKAQMRYFKDNFYLKDDLDSAIMTSIAFAFKLEQNAESESELLNKTQKRLEKIHQLLDAD